MFDRPFPSAFRAWRFEGWEVLMADDNRQGGDKEPSGNNWMKSLLIWAGILLALVLFVQVMGGGSTRAADSIESLLDPDMMYGTFVILPAPAARLP